MTTLTMRLIKGHFIVSGPDVEPMKFKSRREARDWCKTHHPTRAGDFKAATGLGAGKQPPAKGAGATLLPGWLKFKNRTGGAPKRSPHSATVKAGRSGEGGSGRLAPNRSRRLHDAGIAPRKLAQDAQP
jgi:hypothetical protein